MRTNLSNMEYSAAEHGMDGHPKERLFSELCALPSFKKVVKLLDVGFRSVEVLLDFFTHEEDCPFPKLEEVKENDRDEIENAREALKEFVAEYCSIHTGLTPRPPLREPASPPGDEEEGADAGDVSRAFFSSRSMGDDDLLGDHSCLLAIFVSEFQSLLRELRYIKHALLQNA
eukprot:gnl/TRDRNA2_/TRDRNA2_160923_c0_seq1.p1 gnl/TRDRNA2_/TRDRNA2_160923_c0~~gnl/TRDRNA2_/TRDRNA2_160923_c0_seq1.p1  ORF type:complete len:173 (+),score=43.37 gnl/TRDRNA2_/TRDRNA2_160923_c0_seq1:57-575(+)